MYRKLNCPGEHKGSKHYLFQFFLDFGFASCHVVSLLTASVLKFYVCPRFEKVRIAFAKLLFRYADFIIERLPILFRHNTRKNFCAQVTTRALFTFTGKQLVRYFVQCYLLQYFYIKAGTSGLDIAVNGIESFSVR